MIFRAHLLNGGTLSEGGTRDQEAADTGREQNSASNGSNSFILHRCSSECLRNVSVQQFALLL